MLFKTIFHNFTDETDKAWFQWKVHGGIQEQGQNSNGVVQWRRNATNVEVRKFQSRKTFPRDDSWLARGLRWSAIYIKHKETHIKLDELVWLWHSVNKIHLLSKAMCAS